MKTIFKDATTRLAADNGMIYSAAMAFTAILALFPFLIFVATLAGFLGGQEVATAAVEQLFEVMPEKVADALSPVLEGLLGKKRGGLLTISILGTVIISSNAVNTLRGSLNRAYNVTETRKPVYFYIQNILFVLGGAIGVLVLGFAIILAPTIWKQAVKFIPYLSDYNELFTLSRYLVATLILTTILIVTHLFLPAGKRKIRDVLPGVCLTLCLWLIAATGFSIYLSHVNMYIALYASLAGLMIAMVFFFMSAVIFVYGAELNRAILDKENSKLSQTKSKS